MSDMESDDSLVSVHNHQQEQVPTLIIGLGDLGASAKNSLDIARAGDTKLGEAQQKELEIICDNLPSAIANRLRKITPKSFIISEVEIKFKIEGRIPPINLGGECIVKFKPGAE